MKKDNVFWGLFFIIAAVLMIISRLDVFADFSFFRLFFVLLLVCWLIHSLIKRDFGGMLFSIAFLCILYDDVLGIEKLTPWPVLGAAFFGSIGLSMIFKKPYENNNSSVYVERPSSSQNAQTEDAHGNTFNFNSSFTSTEKNIHSDDFSKAYVKNSFGKTTVRFDDAIIQNGAAQVVLDVNFGTAELYIPKTWNVVNRASAAFGSISERNAACSNGVPTLTITGNVFCGSVTIFYI